MEIEEFKNILVEKGLKVTPQRLVVLKAISELNHPTAEHIIDFVKNEHPNIAIGTVYKILETFVEKEIINRVRTDKDVMRYDSILNKHHHLYANDSKRIEDYYDENLDTYLKEYFSNKNIPNFKLEEIKINLIGKFKK